MPGAAQVLFRFFPAENSPDAALAFHSLQTYVLGESLDQETTRRFFTNYCRVSGRADQRQLNSPRQTRPIP